MRTIGCTWLRHEAVRIGALLVLIGLSALTVSSAQTQQSYYERRQETCRLIYQTRQIGVQRDSSRVETLIARLQQAELPKPYDRIERGMPWSAPLQTHLYAATIVALGRVGDPRAIPAIGDFVSRPEWRYLQPYATIAVARIKAERAFPHPRTRTEWRQKVAKFTEEAGISLSAIAEDSKRSIRDDLYLRRPDLARLALRTLAEMAVQTYKGGLQDALQELEQHGIVWENDIAAYLTVALAKLPPDQRTVWLMERLRSYQVLTPAVGYVAQALCDQGDKATARVAEWLNELLQERSQEVRSSTYTRTDTLLPLCFRILAGTATPRAQEVLQDVLLQMKQCEESYLVNRLEIILDQYPWTFTADW
ncbi:MAG: hypothetical protein KatS3mg019_0311 [Fimbriimonadales bacterium]|nr:MAG: hypothetical protein KatS3mg019_0311 [Fimbriimonadales bacterium]